MRRITHGDLHVNGSRVPSGVNDQNDECPFDRLVNPADSRENIRSERLIVANAHLLRLRQARDGRSATTADYPQMGTAGRVSFPAHLGWESASFSQQISANEEDVRAEISSLQPEPQPNLPAAAHDKSDVIIAHPSILTAMLREEVETIGRIWLLARHVDRAGRGWLHVDTLRAELTDKSSVLRCVGWRRLRQLLTAGQGKFWERDRFGRIFLYSPARLAQQLGVTKLTGNTILLTLQSLLGRIGTLRASFYASFHSGRATHNASGMPISRMTLCALTGVSERSQRQYDKTLAITRKSNCVEIATKRRDAYWQGNVIFEQNGKQFRRLPNSYGSHHQTISTRQKKRINQRLQKDLVKFGTQGNSCNSIERIFYRDGRQASLAVNRGGVAILSNQGKWYELHNAALNQSGTSRSTV